MSAGQLLQESISSCSCNRIDEHTGPDVQIRLYHPIEEPVRRTHVEALSTFEE